MHTYLPDLEEGLAAQLVCVAPTPAPNAGAAFLDLSILDLSILDLSICNLISLSSLFFFSHSRRRKLEKTQTAS
jgi:hypothetical protein